MNIFTKQKITELFLYVFFGVVSTVVNIAIFYVFTNFLCVHYLLSNLIAWIFSVIFAFVTNKIWVFKSKSWQTQVWIKECVSFVLARVLTCVLDMACMFLMVSVLIIDETVSKIVANVLVVASNYILSKLLIFNKK